MKLSRILLILVIFFASASIVSSQSSHLKLYCIPDLEASKPNSPQIFNFYLKNISAEPVNILDPEKSNLAWGGYNVVWFVESDGQKAKEDTYPRWSYGEKLQKNVIKTLNLGDSVKLPPVRITLDGFKQYKIYATYIQDSESMTDQYKETLKNNYNKLSYIKVNSDTILYDYRLTLSEPKEYISYDDLNFRKKNGSITIINYGDRELKEVGTYSLDVSIFNKLKINFSKEDDRKKLIYLPFLKNVKWLDIEMDITDTIPNVTDYLTNIVYLKLTVNGNELRKRKIQGLEQFAKINTLEYIQLNNIYQTGSEEWIYSNKKLRVLSLQNAVTELSPQITSLDSLRSLNLSTPKQKIENKNNFKLTGFKMLRDLWVGLANLNYDDNFIANCPLLNKVYYVTDDVRLLPNFKSNSIEDIEIRVIGETVPSYPKGINELFKAKRIVMDGNFGNIEAPDFSACTSLDFFVIRDQIMTKVSPNIFKIRERGVKRTYVHAPKLIEVFNIAEK